MSAHSPINPTILKALRELDPGSTFTPSGGPKITSSDGRSFYAKTGRRSDLDQYRGEVESLKAMGQAAPGLCPRVLAFGDTEGEPFMISEYMDLGSLDSTSAAILAKRLATEMHDPKNSADEAKGRFGFPVPTYCGVTRLENGWFDTWEECYSSLIRGLLNGLPDRGAQSSEVRDLGNQVVQRVIPYLLSPNRLRDIEPVILHGDLWSGNVGTLSNGQPMIFDPSSYYGHSEADLVMARIFGGFGQSFFAEYHSHRPKSEPVDEYDERVALYEMFHYLNHMVIFGDSYASPTVSRMRRLLRYVSDRQP